MRKIALLIFIVLIIGISAVAYSDFRSFSKKNALYNESLRIDELCSKYDSILNQADDIYRKVEVLGKKKIEDDKSLVILKQSESFLKKAESIKEKYVVLLKEYNVISKQYNTLPEQKLFYRDNLPKTIFERTQRMPSADR